MRKIAARSTVQALKNRELSRDSPADETSCCLRLLLPHFESRVPLTLQLSFFAKCVLFNSSLSGST